MGRDRYSAIDAIRPTDAGCAVGQPNEMALAVAFLASDDARYIHGTIVNVDGGWLGR